MRVPPARLSAHALPEAAARVAGEVLALAALLGTALKLDGRLTMQTKATVRSIWSLPIIMAPTQDDADRGVRGYARLDADALWRT